MTALKLATAARVSAAMLEDQLERRHYQKAAATTRKLQERIEAMARRIEAMDMQLLAAMAAARVIPGAVKKPLGGRVNPCAMVPGEEEQKPKPKRKRPAKKRQAAHDIRPMTNRRIRELDSPCQRIIKAYVRGEIEAGQELTVTDLRKRFSVHYPEELQLDLAFLRAPFRLVREGNGPMLVRAA